MKKLLLLLTLFSLYFLGCSDQKNTQPKITFNESAYIKLIVSNVIDSMSVKTDFYSYFPISRELRKDFKIHKEGSYYLEYEMIIPGLVDFKIDENSFTTYLIPGDTLEIRLQQAIVSPNNSITSYFIFDELYNYYQMKYKEFGYYMIMDNHGPLRVKWFSKMITTQKELEIRLAEADSVQNRSINFLEVNSKNLPDWFIKMEKNNIIYSLAYCKLLFWGSLTHFSQKLDHTVNVPIYNSEAYLSFEYYRFIKVFYTQSNPSENFVRGTQRMLNILDKEYPRIDSTLQGEIKNFFLTGYIAESYSNSQSDIESSKVDGFLKSHKLNLSPEGLKYINNIKENSLYLRNNGELQTGDNAPNFDLKDLAGKNYSLSDFKDKFIYLHFWATWCKPCIEEFPALNKLIANVNNDQFVFINVCMDNAYSKWKTIINEKNLMGINLICDENWSKKLYSLYEISGLPHYTFIDKNGLIIKNNYVRPGNVTTEFSNLLDEK